MIGSNAYQDAAERLVDRNRNVFSTAPLSRSLPVQSRESEMAKQVQGFISFMNENPTVYHATASIARNLEFHGFKRISERGATRGSLSSPRGWDLKKPGKYYITRNGTGIIAFVIGEKYKPGNGFAMVGGHTDSLCLKVKPVSKKVTKDGYLQLGVAPYAGAQSMTWWDRDLGLGGRVVVSSKDGKSAVTKLVKLPHAIGRIPTLAPHFGTPSQGPFNLETQMTPIIGLEPNAPDGTPTAREGEKHPSRLIDAIARELGVDASQIEDADLEMFDTQPAQLGGLDGELLFCPRLDDKICTFAAFAALIRLADDPELVANSDTISLAAGFDDEEIGSRLRQGAMSNFLESTIDRILSCMLCTCCNNNNNSNNSNKGGPSLAVLRDDTMANSFFVSSDVSHAVNPNFSGVYLDEHKPRLNVGPVMSFDPNGHMTTDAESSALLHRIAKRTKTTIQYFQIRNDSRSGGTIGPMTSAKLGVRAVEIGIPQLSMHSIRATTGSKDLCLAIDLFHGVFKYWSQVDNELVGLDDQ